MTLLTSKEIDEHLAELKGWLVTDGALQKIFEFENYMSGIRFVNTLAGLAEAEDHHPEIVVGYSRVTVRIATHSEGGITLKDFRLAEGTDNL